MNRAQILVVDDESDLLELVRYNFAAARYNKLGRFREMIETTRGVGYRFKTL